MQISPKNFLQIKDEWLDNIDWVKVKETNAEEARLKDERDEAEDEAEAAYDELAAYKNVLKHLKEGETVAKALRRLAGGGDSGKRRAQLQRKLQQKLKKGQKLTPEEEQLKHDQEAVTVLTGHADSILSRSGVYF